MPRTSRLILAVISGAFIALAVSRVTATRSQSSSASEKLTVAPQTLTYLGFDRNDYPGDDAMLLLRKDFVFTGYWLGPPPGEKTNTWFGKREFLRSHDFGFLVLYRGRDSRELKDEAEAAGKGVQDSRSAAAFAKAEGFSAGTIIFLDIEEGGRLPPTYHTYLRAWYDELTKAGFHPGVYCSGIPVKEDPRATITTVADIHDSEAPRDFIFWAYNDACPPSPGCAFRQQLPAPSLSGISYAAVWQFAQSPRRKEFAAKCAATYHRDGNCYAPGDSAHSWFLDVNSATSPDPSGGAK
jgi:glycoside hydrolase-like protein